MNIISTIEVIMSLVNLLVQYEPKLESDVKDIVAIIHKIRDSAAAAEGKK